ncbi:glycosyltransferase [Mammaliicoccus sp. F-M27]|uniref:glycosyltransferase n=1 Tax=Mammaliicoccus sp. F-M27 TaxID=2898687 RepID=UPI001EFBFDCE|nr:glycosyltransferase [Mammaliicoccus sp. F-M27]
MKIVQINAVNGIKSTGRSTIELSECIKHEGYESYIVYSEGLNTDNSYKIGNKIEKKIHALLSRVIGKQGYYSDCSTKKLIKYFKKINPDIIHLNNLHANYINIEILMNYIIEHKKSVVLTLHDCWFYTGKCTHYTADNCFRWKDSCGSCPRLKKDIPSIIFDRTTTMLRDKEDWYKKIEKLAVIGVSDWITEEAKKSVLAEASIIQRIYNGIDLKKFYPKKNNEFKKHQNLQDKYLILGVASHWTSEKGLNKFIELSEILDENEVIILIGNISDMQKLPKNIINIKETEKIELLADIYSSADLFLNLSLEESFGKTTAESLACGTPAIVYNSTANPELIGKGCGEVLYSEDINELREKINKIKVSSKSEYSNACRKYAEDNFDKNKNNNMYIELYKELLR